jgi:hypothetical protein
MAKCVAVQKKCQVLEAKLDYGFDWTQIMARKWASDRPYTAGVTVRPASDPTGFQYVSSGGQSGAIEPKWPRALGASVVDGSLTWTAELYDATSLKDEIASDLWTAASDLSVAAAAPVITPGLQQTSAVLSGGVAGQTYVVDNEVFTTGGLEYVARIELSIVA